ncbi:hypothetical protein HIM_00501 [Hirsutella minnesotensis 3608]|nr:hypothetical protein HIM_00501 [Hirsutella minnesotensis 3608]
MRRLRPFALPLGVGTDICRISRIYGILDGPRRERFVRRILAPEELARDGSRIAVDGTEGRNGGERRDPALWKMAVFMAGRFAAKEAAIKAHAPLRAGERAARGEDPGRGRRRGRERARVDKPRRRLCDGRLRGAFVGRGGEEGWVRGGGVQALGLLCCLDFAISRGL